MTRIDIVMPVWNAGRYLDETLGMLSRQTHTNFRLVAVDDGSSDDSPRILQEWKRRKLFDLHVITQENRGVAAARNQGLAAISEPLIALLDADDIWHPIKLALQVKYLDHRGEVQAVGCAYETWSQKPHARSVSVNFHWGRDAVKSWATFRGRGPLLPSTLALRTAILDSVGVFDDDLSTAADLEFAARLVANHEVNSLEEVLVRYRIHGSQMHLSSQALMRDYMVLANDADFRHSLGLSREEMLASYAAYLAAKASRECRLPEAIRYARRAWRLDPGVTMSVLSASARRATRLG